MIFMSEPKVGIIIPVYNWVSIKYKNKVLPDICLNALNKTNYKNYKILISDDNSTDNTVSYLHLKYPKLKVIENSINGGFCKNSNSGIRYAIKNLKLDYIVLLNDDIIITDKDWLKNMVVTIAESDDKIGAVGCKLIYPNGRIQSTEYVIKPVPRYVGRSEPDKNQYDYIRETNGVNGALALIKIKALKKVGLLDENFYMGFDDADLSIRLKEAGYKIIYDGLTEAIHLESASTTNKISDKRFYLVQLGFAYLAFKHYNIFEKIISFIFIIGGSIFTVYLPNKKRSIFTLRLRDKPLWRFYASIKAIANGYKVYKKL